MLPVQPISKDSSDTGGNPYRLEFLARQKRSYRNATKEMRNLLKSKGVKLWQWC
jgi:hypothetical protein